MATEPSAESKSSSEPPSPEVLKPQSDETHEPEPPVPDPATAKKDARAVKRLRRGTYRPSHKATFIGLAAVVTVLAVNAGIIYFVVNRQGASDSALQSEDVVISQEVLDGLGVNRTPLGDEGVELVVGPDSRFAGKVEVGGSMSIAGDLSLNSRFTASSGSFAQLESGNTSVSQLNVNGDGTVSTLNLRNELVVAGTSRFQGTVTIGQLLTVNNNVNVTGSLAVGGTLSVNRFQASNIVTDTNLTIGGHFITRGSAPNVGPGPAVGTNGTVSISGNDASGTVAFNAGGGAGGGIVANVAFRRQYGNTPRVVVTAIGPGVGSVYVNRSAAGFSIGVNGTVAPGGYAFDYIVME